MPESKFPQHLVFHQDAVRETDANGNEHIWIPTSVEDTQWQRMSTRAQAEIVELGEINALAVRLQNYKESKRNLFRALLNRAAETVDAPIGRDGARVPVEVIGKSRTALLVWAREAGITLSERQIAEAFPQNDNATQLSDAWTLETELSEAVPQLSPLQREMKMLGDTICEQIQEFGEVVADINAEGAEKICICLRQNHGDLDMLRSELTKNTDLAQAFFSHQNAIVDLQRLIVAICGFDKTRFFLERIPDDPRTYSLIQQQYLKFFDSVSPEDYRQQTGFDHPPSRYEHESMRAASDKNFLDSLLCELLPHLNSSAQDAALLDHFSGEMRFINLCAVEGKKIGDRVNGLSSDERIQILTMQDDVERHLHELSPSNHKESSKQELRQKLIQIKNQENETMSRVICDRIQQGEVGIVILGAFHFRSGFGNTSYFPFTYVDDLLAQDKKLRTVVVDPNSLREACMLDPKVSNSLAFR